MQSLMFLGCFDQKLSKKNLWGVGSTPLLVKEGLIHLENEFSFIYDMPGLPYLSLYFATLKNIFDFSVLLNHY